MADLSHLLGPSLSVLRPRSAGELSAPMMPPSRFDTGNRDNDRLPGRSQNTEIQNPVLLRPDQFLTIQQEDMLLARVDELQFGNAAAVADLSHLRSPGRKGLVQGDCFDTSLSIHGRDFRSPKEVAFPAEIDSSTSASF